jgi:methylase of polypeptide subunit release factors
MSALIVPADPSILRQLRESMLAAGYTEEGLREAFGETGADWQGGFLRVVDKPDSESSLSTLATLFLFGASIEKARASRALAPLDPSDLAGIGLLEVEAELVRPQVLLIPHESLIVAGDLGVAQRNYVERVDRASTTLSDLTVRRPVSCALDLGTGGGIQGLMAARHSEKVVATDVNPRALSFAAFNARLNGFGNLDYLEGSWFEPVAGRKFDLIVANPPYVISPESTYLYRDSGLPGDTICRKVVGEAAVHLREGGFATILCNWVHGANQHWSIPLREWVDKCGCDAIFLHYGSDQSLTYAVRWNRSLLTTDRKRFEGTVNRWLKYYRELGIETIAYGAVILRRRASASNWVQALDVPAAPSGPSADHILRLFAAQDFLETSDGDRLLDQTFALVEGHRLDQTLTHHSGQYLTQPAMMRLPLGIGLEGEVDSQVLGVLFACDGRRTLIEAITEASDQLGLEQNSLTKLSVSTIRKLFELGLIERVAAKD